jgi:hypothetical protein
VTVSGDRDGWARGERPDELVPARRGVTHHVVNYTERVTHAGDLFEEDEPPADVARAFDEGAPFVTARSHRGTYVDCAHHGAELVSVDTFHVCHECQHPFTAQELLDAHNALLAALRVELATSAPAPSEPLDVELLDASDPADVQVCPLCTHTF